MHLVVLIAFAVKEKKIRDLFNILQNLQLADEFDLRITDLPDSILLMIAEFGVGVKQNLH